MLVCYRSHIYCYFGLGWVGLGCVVLEIDYERRWSGSSVWYWRHRLPGLANPEPVLYGRSTQKLG